MNYQKKIAKLFIAWILFLIPRLADALTVSPYLLELGGSPGDTLSSSFQVFNETNSPKTLYISTDNFTVRQDREGEPFFVGEVSEDTLAAWIEYSKSPIYLAPGEAKQIEFKIKIPSFAPAGGHFAAIFLGDKPTKTESTAVGVVSRTGVMILLRVEGKIIEQGRLLEFKLKDRKSVFNSLPVAFTYRFENFGNVHLKPTGFIEIRNMFGGLAASLVVNEKNSIVLPSSVRTFENQWLKKFYNEPPQSFFETIKYQQENFALGRYVARLNLQFGKDGQVALGELTFWVLPWQLILFDFIIVVAVAAILIILIKKYNQFIISRAINNKRIQE